MGFSHSNTEVDLDILSHMYSIRLKAQQNFTYLQNLISSRQSKSTLLFLTTAAFFYFQLAPISVSVLNLGFLLIQNQKFSLPLHHCVSCIDPGEKVSKSRKKAVVATIKIYNYIYKYLYNILI